MNESSNYSSVLGYESVSNTTTHSWDCTREELYTLTNSQIYSWAQVCNESACYRQEYYTTFYSLIGSFFQSIVFIVGVLGNILVCAVVLKTRSMRTTTNCYLGGSQVKIWVINSYLVLHTWIANRYTFFICQIPVDDDMSDSSRLYLIDPEQLNTFFLSKSH